MQCSGSVLTFLGCHFSKTSITSESLFKSLLRNRLSKIPRLSVSPEGLDYLLQINKNGESANDGMLRLFVLVEAMGIAFYRGESQKTDKSQHTVLAGDLIFDLIGELQWLKKQ